MEDFLILTLLILSGVIVALDSFSIMMVRGAQQREIKATWFFKRGIINLLVQTFMLRLGNILGLYLGKSEQAKYIQIIALVFAVGLAMTYVFRGTRFEKIPEKLQVEIDSKSAFLSSLMLSVDAFIIGLFLGIVLMNLSIGYALIIALVSILTALIGAYIGFAYGMYSQKILHSIGSAIILITGFIIGFILHHR